MMTSAKSHKAQKLYEDTPEPHSLPKINILLPLLFQAYVSKKLTFFWLDLCVGDIQESHFI